MRFLLRFNHTSHESPAERCCRGTASFYKPEEVPIQKCRLANKLQPVSDCHARVNIETSCSLTLGPGVGCRFERCSWGPTCRDYSIWTSHSCPASNCYLAGHSRDCSASNFPAVGHLNFSVAAGEDGRMLRLTQKIWKEVEGWE